MVEIRLVHTSEDRAALQGLRLEYEDMLPSRLRHSVPDPPLTAFIALHDGEACACVGLLSLAPHEGAIRHLYVQPAHRGAGIAQLLMRAAIRLARRRGYERVVLDTDKNELAAAYALYLRMGFRPCEPYGPVDYATPTFMELRLSV